MEKDLKETFKEALNSAATEFWPEVKEELRKEVYCSLGGYKNATFRIIDGTTGDTWWDVKLNNLVNEYIEDSTNGCDGEEIIWLENLAKDFERQAKKLRKTTEVIRNMLNMNKEE